MRLANTFKQTRNIKTPSPLFFYARFFRAVVVNNVAIKIFIRTRKGDIFTLQTELASQI